MTTAFVLSGGGIRGPLQVGALRSLLEHGIKPDFFVGTSAGSINSAFMAARGPSLDAIPELESAWRKGTKDVVYPGNAFTIAWRAITGEDSAFPSEGMRKLIADNLPAGVTTFGQLKLPTYLTAADLISRRLYLFGEDPAAPLIDGVMASSSIPVYQDPVNYHDLELVDGGVVACVPCSVAMDKGADVIYAINVAHGTEALPRVSGILNILMRTIDTFIGQSLFNDLKRAEEDPRVELHHIHITDFSHLPFNDFNHIDEMFVAGKAATDRYLEAPAPLDVQMADIQPAQVVPGVREFIPPYMR
jgi:NTE family protein